MFPFCTPRFLLSLLFIFSISMTFSHTLPVPASDSNSSSQAANATDSNTVLLEPSLLTTIPASFVPRAETGTATRVKYSYYTQSHRPVGYAYLPTAQADEYNRNKQAIPLSELQLPGITDHGTVDRFLLQKLFWNSNLPGYRFVRRCIVFSPKKKLPKNLSDKFSMKYGSDAGSSLAYHSPPAYTEESTIGFNQLSVPTYDPRTGGYSRAKRTVMRLPHACVQTAEEIELYAECIYPKRGGDPTIPYHWGSADWHKWNIPWWPAEMGKNKALD
ncbi:hypothetical protein F5890DRAFT_1536816 [Lentinula detonsa]|uniref:Uncharacterized protein n=1 Tax=Lentinula detonsa TaxID=2804962 RepID=A0AA38PTX0_9AGAR|nr:hypothetical protein F5890DRAFT_1536816 [Lentinula detonsa]